MKQRKLKFKETPNIKVLQLALSYNTHRLAYSNTLRSIPVLWHIYHQL
jgi:hypothetical protein